MENELPTALGLVEAELNTVGKLMGQLIRMTERNSVEETVVHESINRLSHALMELRHLRRGLTSQAA